MNSISNAMCTKFFLLCLLAVELPGQVLPISRWDEEAFDSNLFDDEESMEEIARPLFSNEYPTHREQYLEAIKRVFNPGTPSHQQRLNTRVTCSCEEATSIEDLGVGFYPRHLTTSKCKKKPCQDKFHSCTKVGYTVYILHERTTNVTWRNEYREVVNHSQVWLPESLSHKWQFSPKYIHIGCVSTSSF